MTTRRKTLRHEFADAALIAIPALQKIYTSFPEDFSGQSPLLIVADAPEKPGKTPTEPGEVILELSLWVRRDDDPDGAEDLLDDLSESLTQLVLDEFRGWFPVASEPDYTEFDGNSWRMEFFQAQFYRP